jgi:UPF0271 protein
VPSRNEDPFQIGGADVVKLDLNCDLGEGEPATRTWALMRRITSANVACGGHAGNVASMESCVQLCKQFDVFLGAHPGTWHDSNFGRGSVRMPPAKFELLLLQQISALEKIAKTHRLRLHHIKLHGALYHATEADQLLARRYIETVNRYWPKAKIFGLAGGRVVQLARRSGLAAWDEAFADRAYHDDGTLVPRSEPGAVLSDVTAIEQRVRDLRDGRGLLSASGRALMIRPETLCIHSDTPSAVVVARRAWEILHCRS